MAKSSHAPAFVRFLKSPMLTMSGTHPTGARAAPNAVRQQHPVSMVRAAGRSREPNQDSDKIAHEDKWPDDTTDSLPLQALNLAKRAAMLLSSMGAFVAC
jgi:hypothetical protein